MFASLVPAAAAAAEGGGFDPFQFAPGATFWSIVIFVGALLPMWKFVFGPITRALAERDRQVVEAAQAAEQARKDAEAAVAAAKAEQDNARAEARRLVDEATARAERQGEEALRRAKEEADRQLANVRAEIDVLKQKALQEIRGEVVALAIGSARQILGKEVDQAAHQRLVGDFLETAGAAD